jgi:D-alanine-D-alanine ligase
MKIVVIAGGLSPERDVSLSSGSLIANALIDIGYEVCLVDLYRGVKLKYSGSFEKMFLDSKSKKRYKFSVPEREPDLDKLKKESSNGDLLIGPNVIGICRYADLVFMGLHGDIGENGKLQAVFDTYAIKYTGTGYIGSLLAMDKDLAKTLMAQNDILTPEWTMISPLLKGAVKFPCVVKPNACGSSVGVSVVRTEGEYAAALEYAEKYEGNIMVEKMIAGREFSVGILDGVALPVIEIIPKEGFYDYRNKYQKGLADEVCPADLPEAVAKEMQDIALRAHKTLRLGSYSRIDFILENNTNDIYFLEANTLPGMTPTSLLPQEAAAVGISYEKLCDKIVKMAVKLL